MKKYLIASVMLSAIGAFAHAGDVKITWQDPDKYTDVRSATERTDKFQEHVQHDLGEVFNDLATKLPDGYHWDVTVTDIDLAGDISPWRRHGFNEVRVLKDLYPPKISFSYTLKDQNNQVVAEASENLLDASYLQRSVRGGNQDFFYESRLLREWFGKKLRDKSFPSK